MKKNHLKYIIVISFLLSSCTKNFLDKQPLDAYSNSSLWTSADDANSALNGVYNGDGDTWSDATSIVIYFDCMSDNCFSQYPWESYQSFGNGSVTPTLSSTYAANFWNYTTITKCNFFLANINRVKMDTTTSNQMIAQVRFIRAYRYYLMSELYGDVPLVTNVLTIDQANSSVRTPVAVVDSFILNELTAAASDLPVSYPPSEFGHITKGAALALKARVELYNKDYTDCIKDCQAVMGLGYSLSPSYTDLFRIDDQYTNPGIILSAQYVENPAANSNWTPGYMASQSSGGFASLDPLQSLVDAYEMKNGKPISDPTSGYDPNNPYKDRDPRLAATILYPGAPFVQPGATSISYFDPVDAASPDYYGTHNASRTGYIENKFISNMNDFDNLFQTGLNLIILRYAEILLSYAEAKIELGQIDASVYNAIDLVRNRAGMPSIDESVYNTQSSLRELVRNERRVEFALEGLRFFDIKRWNTGADVMNGPVYGVEEGTVNPSTGQYTITGDSLEIETRVFNAARNYLWPVPQTEININSKLAQNPGY